MKLFEILSLLAGSTGLMASPVLQRQDSQPFSIIAISRSRVEVHLQPVNANGGLFWIGKEPSSSAPVPEACPCPSGDTTVFKAGNGHLTLATLVPGVQEVYLQATHGDLPGALSYNGPHTSPPGIAITEGFFLDGNRLAFANSNWVACPVQGHYLVYANGTNSELPSDYCIPLALQSVPFDGGAGAYQYDV